MWITQGLQGHSSHSITTVHYWRRDSRQERWTVKAEGKEGRWRKKMVAENVKDVKWLKPSLKKAWSHLKRQGHTKWPNMEEKNKLVRHLSMCDSGLPLQVLALDYTRTSENRQPSDLWNVLALQSIALHWFEMPVRVHSFPFSVLFKQVPFKLKGVYTEESVQKEHTKKQPQQCVWVPE